MKAVALGVLAAGLMASASNAGIIFNSNGFEAPAYATGALEGQNGWLGVPTAHGAHSVVNTTVSGVAPIGGQMVQATFSNVGTRYSFPDISAGVVARPVGEDWIWAQWDFNNPTGSTATAFAGVVAYDALGSTIAAFFIRPSDGLLVGQFDPAGAQTFNLYSLGLAAPKGQWFNFGLAINVVTGALAFTSGDAILLSGSANTNFATLGDFDIQTNGSTIAGSVFFDNYVVSSTSVVPAPSAAALLGMGVFARRRRR